MRDHWYKTNFATWLRASIVIARSLWTYALERMGH